jgi:Helix-turn-helix domain
MKRTNKTSGPADGAAVSLDEPLLDCVAAAALLNVRVSWVRDAARLGHLPCLRVGRHLRFTRVMLEDRLAEQVAVSSTPARAYSRPPNGPGVRSSRGRFRRSTQAALRQLRTGGDRAGWIVRRAGRTRCSPGVHARIGRPSRTRCCVCCSCSAGSLWAGPTAGACGGLRTAALVLLGRATRSARFSVPRLSR